MMETETEDQGGWVKTKVSFIKLGNFATRKLRVSVKHRTDLVPSSHGAQRSIPASAPAVPARPSARGSHTFPAQGRASPRTNQAGPIPSSPELPDGRFRQTNPAAGPAPAAAPGPGRGAQHGGAAEEEAPRQPAPRARRQPRREALPGPLALPSHPIRRDKPRSGGLSPLAVEPGARVPTGSPTEAGRARGSRSPSRFLIHPGPGGAGTAERREPLQQGQVPALTRVQGAVGDRGHHRVSGAVPRKRLSKRLREGAPGSPPPPRAGPARPPRARSAHGAQLRAARSPAAPPRRC